MSAATEGLTGNRGKDPRLGHLDLEVFQRRDIHI
jgi:hypothetical protein